MREGVGVRRYPKQEAGGSCDAPRQEWGATGNWRGLSQQLGSQQGIHLTKLGSPLPGEWARIPGVPLRLPQLLAITWRGRRGGRLLPSRSPLLQRGLLPP